MSVYKIVKYTYKFNNSIYVDYRIMKRNKFLKLFKYWKYIYEYEYSGYNIKNFESEKYAELYIKKLIKNDNLKLGITNVKIIESRFEKINRLLK